MGAGASSRRPRAGGDRANEDVWHIGGRYHVVKGGAHLWDLPDLQGMPARALGSHTPVLLLAMRKNERGETAGFITPSQVQEAQGWTLLESQKRPRCLVRQRLVESWAAPARYVVQSQCTLRAGVPLESDFLQDLGVDREVIVLELAAILPGEKQVATTVRGRLRMHVSLVGSDTVGWLTPETKAGHKLLSPVNLLGPEVVSWYKRPPTCPQDRVPQDVGGEYRVLQVTDTRALPFLHSPVLGSIHAASLVTISSIETVPCDVLTMCPVALVVVSGVDDAHDDAAAEQWRLGRTGWVRLVAEDGTCTLDLRNQREPEAILKRISESTYSGPHLMVAPPAGVSCDRALLE
eukprot:TRINITY_DN21602_c0_g1_i1.p1 TRINITY_DN21602_c0_g1~~TRINITY_DN21602_c0_g1_i1.p1  ORF type:complete len:349 (+),score=50.33 TRINITY_DN21602_c0_g1_i1:218-1264(+)